MRAGLIWPVAEPLRPAVAAALPHSGLRVWAPRAAAPGVSPSDGVHGRLKAAGRGLVVAAAGTTISPRAFLRLAGHLGARSELGLIRLASNKTAPALPHIGIPLRLPPPGGRRGPAALWAARLGAAAPQQPKVAGDLRSMSPPRCTPPLLPTVAPTRVPTVHTPRCTPPLLPRLSRSAPGEGCAGRRPPERACR